ncbi:MAG: integrase arm-type DNA-binding domain-containing protein [Rhodobacteraceae bacterium]|nr:integrase arm-type DNA-binding domain-containing protein [Paracoccaceae bacterium]
MTMHGVRKPKTSLTAQFARNVTAPGEYCDGNGLYLRVNPSGSKQWVQRIVIRGKRSEMGLGGFPLVGLAEARSAALDNRRLARAGGDPLAERRRAREVPSFEAAARKVHEMHGPTWRNDKHRKDFITSLELYAFPKIGSKRVSEVSTADLLVVLSPIWTSKAETARRVRQRIGTVLKWAIAQGWREDNPAESVTAALPKVAKAPRHRKSLPYRRVAECLATVWASNASQSTKLALEFLILTAARSGEVRHATWDEIDLHGADSLDVAARVTWVVSAERMKMKREHRVPLSTRAVEILRRAEDLRTSSGLIFPSLRDKALSDMTLSKLVKELGFEADVHGFRTSFRTWAQEQTDFPAEVAEAALAHATGDAVVKAYARSDVFERRRAMMQAWCDYLAGGTDAQPSRKE